MATAVTAWASSQSRSSRSSAVVVPKVRTSCPCPPPAPGARTHAVTLFLCTSSPQLRSTMRSIAALLWPCCRPEEGPHHDFARRARWQQFRVPAPPASVSASDSHTTDTRRRPSGRAPFSSPRADFVHARFCVWSKPPTNISWLDRDSTHDSDSAWSAGRIPCRSRRGMTRTLRLVSLGLSRYGCAIELVDLVDEHGRVEVGRRHRALDQLLLLEDVLERRPLRESADAEARIGTVVHPLQHEARVEHVQRVLERLGLVARLRLRLRIHLPVDAHRRLGVGETEHGGLGDAPREADEHGGVLRHLVVARRESLAEHLVHHGQIETTHLHAAVLDGGLQGVPQREAIHRLLLQGEPARRANSHREDLDVLLGIEAGGGDQRLGEGHRTRGERRHADSLALEICDLLERALAGYDEAIDRLTRLNVKSPDLDALLTADHDLLGAEGDDLEIARRELLHARRRALHARHRHVEALLLPVAEGLGQRGVTGVADGDVLGGDGEHHLLERLVLRVAGRPQAEQDAHDRDGGDDALHRESSLSGPEARVMLTR